MNLSTKQFLHVGLNNPTPISAGTIEEKKLWFTASKVFIFVILLPRGVEFQSVLNSSSQKDCKFVLVIGIFINDKH